DFTKSKTQPPKSVLSQTGPAPRVYLDTCIISSLVKCDLSPEENDAVEHILDAYQATRLQLYTSPRAKEEIQRNRLPEHRNIQTRFYKLISALPVVQEVNTDSGLLLMGVGGGSHRDRLYAELLTLLTEYDAKHVFQAIKNRMDVFITTDGGILKR